MSKFTAAEKTFMDRMAIHMIAGMSFDEAAKAVVEDDQRIRNICLGQTESGEKARAVLATEIYFDINKRDAVERIFEEDDHSIVVNRLNGFTRPETYSAEWTKKNAARWSSVLSSEASA